MITYSATYTPGERPYLSKVLTVGSESMEVRLGYGADHGELDAIPLDFLYQHLDNLALYIKSCTNELRVSRLTDPAIDTRFPFIGYTKVDDAIYESCRWWEYIFTHREPEEETPA